MKHVFMHNSAASCVLLTLNDVNVRACLFSVLLTAERLMMDAGLVSAWLRGRIASDHSKTWDCRKDIRAWVAICIVGQRQTPCWLWI